MKSIRRGLWDGEVEKNTRGRFTCRICGQSLKAADSEEGATVRTCPNCDRAWEST